MGRGSIGGKRGKIISFPKKETFNWYQGIEQSMGKYRSEFQNIKENKRLTVKGKSERIASLDKALKAQERIITSELENENRIPKEIRAENKKRLMQYRRETRTLRKKLLNPKLWQ